MSFGRALGMTGVLLIALLGCATDHKPPDFYFPSKDPEKAMTPAQNGVITWGQEVHLNTMSNFID